MSWDVVNQLMRLQIFRVDAIRGDRLSGADFADRLTRQIRGR
jgi:hypothetical protein